MRITCKAPTASSLLCLILLTTQSLAVAQFSSAKALKVVMVQAQKPATPVAPGGQGELVLRVSIKKPYHVNSNPASQDLLIPTLATAEAVPGFTFGKPLYPAGQKKKFAFFPEPLSVYEDMVSITLPFTVAADAAAGTRTVHGGLKYQACDDKSCLPPVTLQWTAPVAIGQIDGVPPDSELFKILGLPLLLIVLFGVYRFFKPRDLTRD